MTRSVAIVILVLTACSLSTTSTPPDGRLVPAIASGNWGYIDRDGLWQISPAFKSAKLFSEGLAAVRTSDGWGFVDSRGELRIKPQFGAVGDFKSGIAPVRVGRRWGFIDTSGKWIVEPQYQAASEFSEGRARVELWDKVCSFRNEDAPEHFFQRKYTERNNFPNGGQCGAENSRVGYVNTKGNEVIALQYLEAFDFSEGRAQVVDRRLGRFGYIDTEGNIVLNFQYSNAGPFSEGLAAVDVIAENGKPGGATVINRSGQQMFPPRFAVISKPFSEGLAPAMIGTIPRWIYIDRDGATKIGRRFIEASSFSEGLAVVSLESVGDQAYIDKFGRIVFHVPSGGSGQPIENGIAAVKFSDDEFEYFDSTGRQILPKNKP